MRLLEVRELNVEIGGETILQNITFDIEKKSVLAIIGPNGAGKTVLLKALLGLLPSRGTIKWKAGIRKGYVPQRLDIETDIPLTVREFFRLRSPAPADESIKRALGYVQLDASILEDGFGEVSVGQRQRVLVAWAVIGEPDVLLFDEPTADIDLAGQESIYNMISHLKDNLGLTVILVSHDLNVVYSHAAKVICLNKNKLCIGKPREVLTPEQLQGLYGGDNAFFKHRHG
ncbi:MAG: metal ABC transporter ATP-binding protein [Thermodesulfobacteriota bacterium]